MLRKLPPSQKCVAQSTGVNNAYVMMRAHQSQMNRRHTRDPNDRQFEVELSRVRALMADS
jgi:hypothetical protein